MAEEAMTLREHLDELRKRLMWSVIFLALAVGAAFVFRDYILEFLLEPGYGGTGEVPIATEVMETLSVVFKVTLMVGFAAALPLILYQVIKFVSPGLTTRERVYLWVFLPAVIVAFVGGCAFAYYVLFPPAFDFLANFGGDYVDEQFKISSYISILISLMFWMGVVFQIPMTLFALARFGVVTPRWLAKFRRFFVVIAFIAAAIITPTIDVTTQSLVAVPIIILYEFGILLARLGQRLRQGAEEYETIDHNRPFFLKRWLRAAGRPFRVLRFWRWQWRFWRWHWRFWRRGPKR